MYFDFRYMKIDIQIDEHPLDPIIVEKQVGLTLKPRKDKENFPKHNSGTIFSHKVELLLTPQFQSD